jgi:flagellar hook assembly protein FlgD
MDWFGVDTSVCEDVVTPQPNRLKGNYPNPFNPSTTIEYSIQNPGNMELSIYNLRGQKVKSLVNEYKGSGLHKVVWNGTDDQGREVGSGIYLVRMQSSGFSTSKKITLIK